MLLNKEILNTERAIKIEAILKDKMSQLKPYTQTNWSYRGYSNLILIQLLDLFFSNGTNHNSKKPLELDLNFVV